MHGCLFIQWNEPSKMTVRRLQAVDGNSGIKIKNLNIGPFRRRVSSKGVLMGGQNLVQVIPYRCASWPGCAAGHFKVNYLSRCVAFLRSGLPPTSR